VSRTGDIVAPARREGSAASKPRSLAPQGDVRSLSRGLNILKAVANHGTPRGVTLGQLVEVTGLHKSTVHRLVGVLLRDRLLARDTETESYSLGIAVLELGGAYLDRLTPRRVAMPHLEQLMERTSETVHLGILDQHEVVYIEKIEAPTNVIVHTRIGHREMVHCTALGKAMLAFLPDAEIDAVIRRGLTARTSGTVTDPRKFRATLALVRKRGFAVNVEESREHVNAVAAPVFDRLAHPVAAIVISGLKHRLPMPRLLELGALLRSSADAISAQLGHVAHRERA